MRTGNEGRGTKDECGSREVEMESMPAAQNSALGEFVASIAHEITEPLSAIAMNGETSLRWLDRTEPNLGKVRELLQRIVDDARRAADIVAQVQAEATGPEATGPAARDGAVASRRHRAIDDGSPL